QLNLSLAVVPDIGDTLATALDTGLRSLGGTFSNTQVLGNGPFGTRDVDLYRLDVPANSVLRARTSLPAGGLSVDTILRLFDASGTPLAIDDDSAGGLYSAFPYTFPTAGTYYVGVSGHDNRA